ILYILSCFVIGYDFDIDIFLFLSVCLALLHLNQKIIEYRVRKGLYGKNEYEAREMIAYILSYSDKSDFSDGDKLKELFPETVEEESKEAAFEGSLGVVK
ncbi:MAG: hypothetical protein D3909_10455, partial [Candidatus Electrothrix sp. ATG1]|nr:hypothetical protein [Candidatus Electrothrix sp. ATG1]